MAAVGIVMGSDSDMPVMSKAAEILDAFGIDYEMHIISAHREPDVFFEWAKGAEERGIKVIIAGAGMGCASSRHVRRAFPASCHRNSDAYKVFGRARFPVFDRADAGRYSGGDRRDRRRKECRPSCGQDSVGFR